MKSPRSKEWRDKISQNMKRIHAEGKAKIAVRKPLIPRFWEKVQKSEGCWEWTGALLKARGGYGTFNVGDHKTKYAHRFSWEIHYGEIPPGKLVCHHCDNPKCVRPDHLFIGSYWDNAQDAALKGRMGFHPKSHMWRKYSPELIQSILEDPRILQRDFTSLKAKELNIPKHRVAYFRKKGKASK